MKYTFKCSNCDHKETKEMRMSEYKVPICSKCNELMEREFMATPSIWKCEGAYGKQSK